MEHVTPKEVSLAPAAPTEVPEPRAVPQAETAAVGQTAIKIRPSRWPVAIHGYPKHPKTHRFQHVSWSPCHVPIWTLDPSVQHTQHLGDLDHVESRKIHGSQTWLGNP